MNMKKWGILLFVLLFIAAVAVGCGGAKEETPDNNEQPAGEEPSGSTALKDGTYDGVGQGFKGDIKIEVTVAGGKISAIEVVETTETEEIGGVAFPDLVNAVIESQSTDIEAISGATKTSEGFVAALENALEKAAE